ncbi:type II toxin-antitoxin system VapB family antitoxin [Streptomyces sp. NPDC093982]|uniref:type II toxin-antitoxin system VapB family antitoxin n=1 Tax=Streptomyces sp. NPDC093982 TaxID=3155077 RepID=UPI00343DAC3D
MSVTNVDLDDEVLAKAARLLGTTTKKDTINKALDEVVQRHRRRAAYEWLGEQGPAGGLDRLSRDHAARKAAQHGGTGE